ALLQPELAADRSRSLRADIVGQGASALAALAPHDVAEAGLAFALRPRVHAVAERARSAARSGDRPDLVLRIFQHPREHLEARTAEMLGDVLHLERVAQVWLVAAVVADRFRKRNPPPAFCHWLAFGKFLEHP